MKDIRELKRLRDEFIEARDIADKKEAKWRAKRDSMAFINTPKLK